MNRWTKKEISLRKSQYFLINIWTKNFLSSIKFINPLIMYNISFGNNNKWNLFSEICSSNIRNIDILITKKIINQETIEEREIRIWIVEQKKKFLWENHNIFQSIFEKFLIHWSVNYVQFRLRIITNEICSLKSVLPISEILIS